jgi:hypothetical protein
MPESKDPEDALYAHAASEHFHEKYFLPSEGHGFSRAVKTAFKSCATGRERSEWATGAQA